MPRFANKERGFTLIELILAMAILSLLSLAIGGVITIGARSASSGERTTEQARRFRIATTVVTRQIRSAATYKVMDEEENEPIEYFLGEPTSVDFVTTQPQAPNDSGIALVSYWHDTDQAVLMMSETPYFVSFAGDKMDRELFDHLTFETPLLFDVDDVRFEYRRSGFGEDNWHDRWDAVEEEALPAVVKISVDSDLPNGPRWQHEVPVFLGVFNEVTGKDDFSRR